MEIFRQIEAIKSALDWRRKGKKVGLVSTRGHLHEGHVALLKACRDRADISVASIFANPLLIYADTPARPLGADEQLLESLSVDFLFAPSDQEMFPHGPDNSLRLHQAAKGGDLLEARSTVWLKLLNIIEPSFVVCGEKAYGQLVALRRLIREFSIDVELVTVSVARDSDGVAFCSELERLTAEQRRQAPILQQTLVDLAFAIKEGARNYSKLEQTAHIALKGGGFNTREVTIRDAETWSAPAATSTHLRILAEAELGLVALSDNIGVDL